MYNDIIYYIYTKYIIYTYIYIYIYIKVYINTYICIHVYFISDLSTQIKKYL